MHIDLNRRTLLAATPALGLSAILSARPAPAPKAGLPAKLYRIDEPATIIAAAKAVIDEDYIATLITLDSDGVPRARSVGVWAPDNDLVLWIGTRRTSRKVAQIRSNPNATLHFASDDIAGNHANAYYASFMGTATVHTDDATVKLRAPEEKYRRTQWPNFPDDYAAIRFQTKWLEVFGRGIKSDKDNWQPQAVAVPQAER